MKKLLTKDLLEKSVKELSQMRNDFKKELFDMKIKNTMRSLKQTHLISIAKHNIARVNSVLKFKTVKAA